MYCTSIITAVPIHHLNPNPSSNNSRSIPFLLWVPSSIDLLSQIIGDSFCRRISWFSDTGLEMLVELCYNLRKELTLSGPVAPVVGVVALSGVPTWPALVSAFLIFLKKLGILMLPAWSICGLSEGVDEVEDRLVVWSIRLDVSWRGEGIKEIA